VQFSIEPLGGAALGTNPAITLQNAETTPKPGIYNKHWLLLRYSCMVRPARQSRHRKRLFLPLSSSISDPPSGFSSPGISAIKRLATMFYAPAVLLLPLPYFTVIGSDPLYALFIYQDKESP
jgi:hypothetical protein